MPDQTTARDTRTPAAPAPAPAREPAGDPAPDSRPIFFLHIPKTAGTSFLTTLQNLFGEAHTLRLAMDVPGYPTRIADVAEGRAPGIACVNGHLPADLIAGHMARLRPFTILRDPIARVFSVFRFQRNNPDIAQFGLPPGFSFEQFLANRDPALYGQANNGMVRMLAGMRPFALPEDHRYTEIDRHPELIGRALALLEQIDFGLAEDMPGTHRLIRHRWNIPFDLDEITLNTTEQDEVSKAWRNIHAVVERNRLDIVLYERARALFRDRLARLAASPAAAPAAAMVHRPALGVAAALPDVPGRQGFHEWDTSGIAWIVEGHAGRFHFLPPSETVTIRLRVFGIGDDYPFARAELHLNGTRLPFRVIERDGAWCTLESHPVGTRPGVNALAVTVPEFIPVRALHPDSIDRRSLGLAVAAIQFTA